MTENLLSNGLTLTLYGMGTVFVFLVVLIFATRTMSWVVLKFDSPQTHLQIPATKTESSQTSADNTQLVAVISAAVKSYRQTRTRK